MEVKQLHDIDASLTKTELAELGHNIHFYKSTHPAGTPATKEGETWVEFHADMLDVRCRGQVENGSTIWQYYPGSVRKPEGRMLDVLTKWGQDETAYNAHDSSKEKNWNFVDETGNKRRKLCKALLL